MSVAVAVCVAVSVSDTVAEWVREPVGEADRVAIPVLMAVGVQVVLVLVLAPGLLDGEDAGVVVIEGASVPVSVPDADGEVVDADVTVADEKGVAAALKLVEGVGLRDTLLVRVLEPEIGMDDAEEVALAECVALFVRDAE